MHRSYFYRVLRHLRPGPFVRLILITLGICLFLLLVVLPSYVGASNSNAISSALRRARSVTVIEFVRFRDAFDDLLQEQELPLRAVSLSSEQISALQATGGFVDFGWFMPSLCFEPHHRIHIQRDDGQTLNLDVCFLCSNFRMNDGGIQNLPAAWCRRLEQFFTKLEMPPRTHDEYRKLTPKRRVANSER